MHEHPTPYLSRWLVLLMAFATGVAVASNYYNQPLLQTLAEQFDLSYAKAGILVTTAQVSYAVGLILLVPLGDLLERRGLIVGMALVVAGGLLLSALAPSFAVLLLGTALAGMFSVVAQVLVPFAATLAAPEERGRVVGTLMSGLLLGILLARTVADTLSALGNWRSVYLLAAAVMAITALALWFALPRYRHPERISYPRLMASVALLFRDEPEFRLRTLLGGLSFAMFAMLWTPLAFLLSAEPYGYSDGVIGLFGVVGAVGALAASQAGRMADSGRGAQATSLGLLLLALSWLPLGFGGTSLAALLVGVVVLDLAVQLTHVSNMNQVYRLRPEARSRINAGYMTGYFIGGALGSLASAALFEAYGWAGVCSAGAALGVVALGIWLALGRRDATLAVGAEG
ncbi:Predicted arabinose efflux permease, MFS family [Pseudomonas linyingensis]|uniref:Predicted arabinose efflux permease, MFS family n=1 Tax=Pseudomonas linyingensis TaxID=915471 RepID=A0A1H6Y9K7_9PSED|nr:MFS transporter [Pseudomonas linyingensis]SEJ36564.1 Predicted arabinose efflux permease, MFS family [Pseudomonas linyingensis]